MTAPIFSNFVLGCFDITLQAQKSLSLPPIPGAVFRAGFSKIMRKVACDNQNLACSVCPDRKRCHFFWLYENSGEFAQIKLDRFRTPPKPFIFEPPIQLKSQHYRAGDLLMINLILIGEALRYTSKLIVVFQEMEKHKLNGIADPFFLQTFTGKNIITGDTVSLYSQKSVAIPNRNTSFTLPDFIRHHKPTAPISQITVIFKTPTRIKGTGSFSRAISFKILIQTLLTRITALAYNYGRQAHYLNFRELVNLAGEIRIIDQQEPPEFRSKTADEKKHSYLGGYVGQITYQGNLTPFWPWLKVAEIIHLGKNCTFGLGKIHAIL